MTSHQIAEMAHWLGFVPLGWLAASRTREPALWWLAAAFGISFLADSAAHWVAPWIVSAVYPVSQAALICAVFLPRQDAYTMLGLLLVVGLSSLWFTHASGPDLLLHTTAAVAVCWIVAPLPALGMLRTALLIYFGLGLLAWYGYVWTFYEAPGAAWYSWGAFQLCRLVGILCFCRSTLKPQPVLQLA